MPLGWQHPMVPNEHYQFQEEWRISQGRPASRLLPPGMRFVGLCGDYPEARARWEQDVRARACREGHSWTFGVEYHLTGYQGREDAEPAVHPFYLHDGETETSVTVRDEDHLWELQMASVMGEKPNPDEYMPVWSEGEASGWCLYETVSEGTPTTPVFATADELIEHLATVGQDYEQLPMRRAAAETLVSQGHSFGTFLVTGGRLYNSAEDADLIAGGLS